MTVIESSVAVALEGAMRTRIAFDQSAKDAALRLADQVVQLNVSEQSFCIRFEDHRISVSPSGCSSAAHLTLSGSMSGVSQALMSRNLDNVVIQGKSELLDDLRRIFKPPLLPDALDEKLRETGDRMSEAVRSGWDFVATSVERMRTERASGRFQDQHNEKIDQLEQRIAELEARLEAIKSKG